MGGHVNVHSFTPQMHAWIAKEQTKQNTGKSRKINLGVCEEYNTDYTAPAGAAQWTDHQPENQKVTGLIPSRGTGLGCGPGPQ